MSLRAYKVYRQCWGTDDSISRTFAVYFSPQLCVAHGAITAMSTGNHGNKGITIIQHRQRQPDGFDKTFNYGGGPWNEPNSIRVHDCTGVVFETFINFGGGYIITSPIVTLWD